MQSFSTSELNKCPGWAAVESGSWKPSLTCRFCFGKKRGVGRKDKVEELLWDLNGL